MIDRIKFWIRKIYVYSFVIIRNLSGNPWYSVKGVNLPLKLNIGFNTLRWIVNGKYEEGEIELIRQSIEPSDRILEIGAGLGFVSTFCAKIVGSDNVYSFEANPLNFEMALLVYEENNVSPQLQNTLLANSKGIIDFPVNRKSLLASSLLKTSSEIVRVPQLILNDKIEELRPNFLIMDIEGAEYEIFRLIRFQTIKKIQVELHPLILGEAKIKEIFNLLQEKGFVTDLSLPDGRNYFFKSLIS